jgi:hypothetical protein
MISEFTIEDSPFAMEAISMGQHKKLFTLFCMERKTNWKVLLSAQPAENGVFYSHSNSNDN